MGTHDERVDPGLHRDLRAFHLREEVERARWLSFSPVALGDGGIVAMVAGKTPVRHQLLRRLMKVVAELERDRAQLLADPCGSRRDELCLDAGSASAFEVPGFARFDELFSSLARVFAFAGARAVRDRVGEAFRQCGFRWRHAFEFNCARSRERPRPALSSRPRRCPGGDLLSHAVAHAVPSALEGLTSGFGMGPGVTPPLWPPKLYVGDLSPLLFKDPGFSSHTCALSKP